MYKYAQIARPLNKLISGENAKKKHKKVEWGDEQEQAFQKLKEACTKTPVLAYADYKKSFRINTDASELGLGSVLYQQQEDGTFHVDANVKFRLTHSVAVQTLTKFRGAKLSSSKMLHTGFCLKRAEKCKPLKGNCSL